MRPDAAAETGDASSHMPTDVAFTSTSCGVSPSDSRGPAASAPSSSASASLVPRCGSISERRHRSRSVPTRRRARCPLRQHDRHGPDSGRSLSRARIAPSNRYWRRRDGHSRGQPCSRRRSAQQFSSTASTSSSTRVLCGIETESCRSPRPRAPIIASASRGPGTSKAR